ncbi:hypothetical protein [Candidatus Amarobacter glycogenicus]|uniref:hypothetical protein n=1 Tax=Candidatus Amarobacter glycogenicus TaxID=3140699 RepID=UPI003136F4CD|nr:hypothetical protein [Dehalococcoidia bacterium]
MATASGSLSCALQVHGEGFEGWLGDNLLLDGRGAALNAEPGCAVTPSGACLHTVGSSTRLATGCQLTPGRVQGLVVGPRKRDGVAGRDAGFSPV